MSAALEHRAVRDEEGRRWPVVDGIPFMRVGREALAGEVFAALDDGDTRGATLALLADQDDWAPGPPPSLEAREAALDGGVSLREAMMLLGYGPVANYFAFRWSDPTFLSGLGLIGAHAPAGARIFELGCGIGAFLRAVAPPFGAGTIGADVVWSKLWLARRYVVPHADLVCFDAAAGPFPLRDREAGVSFCHDALYFLPRKEHVTAELARVGGCVLIGHTHNGRVENFSAGAPLEPEEYAALLDRPLLYDDAELTRALLDDRVPHPASSPELADAPAIALASAPESPPASAGRLALGPAGAPLQVNPLLDPGDLRPRWPSERYEAEYAAGSRYLVEPPVSREVLARGLAGEQPARDELVRRRILLDLPERW
jgi:SAM-dependent methyltransferase